MDMNYCLKFILIFSLIGLYNFAGAKNDQTNTKPNPDDNDTDKNVKITNLIFPPSIENGTMDYVIMDCKYILRNNDTSLLSVSWFFNNNLKNGSEISNNVLIYKWLFGHWAKGRSFDGPFQNRLDLNHKASDVPWEMYRAIEIMNPTTELTGKYSCQVSTKQGDVTKSQNLIVYSKPKSLDFQQVPSSLSNYINVSCWAKGSYPAPKLVLYYGTNRNEPILEVKDEISWIGSGYDVRVSKLIDKKELKRSPPLISCDVKIPQTSYLKSMEVLYRGILLEDDSENDSSWALSQPTLGQKMAVILSVLCSIALIH